VGLYGQYDTSAGLGGNGSGGAVFANGSLSVVDSTLAKNVAIGGDGATRSIMAARPPAVETPLVERLTNDKQCGLHAGR